MRPADRYRDWHWGIDPVQVVDWRDPDYPHTLIECGRLAEFQIKRKSNSPREKITIADKLVNRSYLAFDPEHRHQRLYSLTPAPVRRDVKRQFWNPSAPTYTLSEVARAAGGHHGGNDYPRVRVQPIGELTHVSYLTNKGSFEEDDEPDGLSLYTHKLGEEGGLKPWLATDAVGRFWICGGDYVAGNRGGIAN